MPSMTHIWVKISYTTVQEVRINPDESITYVISPEAHEAAAEGAVVGCWACEVPLNNDTINTKCIPVE